MLFRRRDFQGGGGRDEGGALPMSTKDFPSLDRGFALFDDPLRNGRLVWDVAVAVAAMQVQQQEQVAALREGRKARQRPKNPAIFRIPFRRPKSMGEARANLTEALALLSGCGLALSPALSHKGVLEAVLQGSDCTLWSLMGAMRSAAASIALPAGAAPAAMIRVIAEEKRMHAASRRGKAGMCWAAAAKDSKDVLPYRRRDVALLEVAVMQWMLTLPLLPDSLEILTSAVCQGEAPPPGEQVCVCVYAYHGICIMIYTHTQQLTKSIYM